MNRFAPSAYRPTQCCDFHGCDVGGNCKMQCPTVGSHKCNTTAIQEFLARNEMVAVHFIKIYCLPSMIYSCGTWSINRSDIRTLDIAWNNAFRKTFNGFWRECVKSVEITVILLLVSSYSCSVSHAKAAVLAKKCLTVTTCY